MPSQNTNINTNIDPNTGTSSEDMVSKPYIFSQHLLEWFVCPQRALQLIRGNGTSLILLSRYREGLRQTVAYRRDLLKPNAVPGVPGTAGTTTDAALQYSLSSLEKKQSMIDALFCMRGVILLYVVRMDWDQQNEGWIPYFGIASQGHRREALLQAVLFQLYCKEENIPIAQTRFFVHRKFNFLDKQICEQDLSDSVEPSTCWRHYDVSKKVNNLMSQEKNTFKQLLSLLEEENFLQDDALWPGCMKQYCESCKVEETYEIDDIRTLRKSKKLVDQLYAEGLRKISEIQVEHGFETVAQRQIDAVVQNSPLYYKEEIQDILSRLDYPRYFLDFEAFSTSVPLMKKMAAWDFVPFLFSLQWQKEPRGPIYTQLWAMPPAEDQRQTMWNILKEHLLGAGSIMVYSSQFEDAVLKQLGELFKEYSSYEKIVTRIVDLQHLFYGLSVYRPEQKGKISLKTIASVWLGISYEKLNVSEGMAANYYYVTLCDLAKGSFDGLEGAPYLRGIYEELERKTPKNIQLKDIMDYCKYDTTVMIRLLSLLEDRELP